MQDKGIENVIDTFVYEVWNEQFLYERQDRMFSFGKIAGYINKGRHMKRDDQPFQRIQQAVVRIVHISKMTDDHKNDQKGFVIIKQVIPFFNLRFQDCLPLFCRIFAVSLLETVDIVLLRRLSFKRTIIINTN